MRSASKLGRCVLVLTPFCPPSLLPGRHSLGGALAMLCAFDCINRCPYVADHLEVKCEGAGGMAG